MIDLHSHLLPGIDDGPATILEAMALARACVADGIGHAVLTPHVFAGRFDNRRSSIEPEFERFRQAVESQGLPLTLSFAGEVRLSGEVLDWMDAGELPFLDGALGGRRGGHLCEPAADSFDEPDGLRHLLLELPDGQIPLGADALVRRLRENGICPVIAHPERNRAVMERPQRIEPFIDAGCLLQVTAGSLVGGFGGRALALAHWLIDQGLVAAVASDAHNLQARRPRMSDARAVLVERHGVAVAFDLLVKGPARLCGLPLAGRANAFGLGPQMTGASATGVSIAVAAGSMSMHGGV